MQGCFAITTVSVLVLMVRVKMTKKETSTIRVGIADKSPLVQAALKQLLSEDGRFNLIVTCSDGERFLEAAEHYDFDIGIIGWIMPNGDGKFILDHLQNNPDAPKIIVYTGHENAATPAQIMARGGAAYVSKSQTPDLLLNTAASVAEGQMIFPFLDVRKINNSPLTTLTKKELEVLSSLAGGRTNKEIAKEMDVSQNTIKFHVRNIYEKLSVRNRSEAIALYLKS